MLIVSHRGYIKKYRENTLEGINYAFTLNFVDGVEFDVRITKDNQFVLLHDFYIDRVSDGTGTVKKMKLKELRKYNFGYKNTVAKIPTLEEILSIKTNKIFLMEIKFSTKEYYKIKNKLIKLLKKFQDKNIYITSFYKEIIIDLKKENLNFLFGVNVTKNIKISNMDFYAVNHLFITEEILKKLKDYPVFLWTINSKNDINKIKKYKKYNNINLIADYPKEVKHEYFKNN